MAKTIRNPRTTTMPPLKDENGDEALCEAEKAEALAKNFEKVHHLTENMGDPMCNEITTKLANLIRQEEAKEEERKMTTPTEIHKIIKKLKSGKAPGKDQITNTILKNLHKKALVQLTHIFNACLKNTYFPQQWKEAEILAFPKPGKDPRSPTSYRPISLLSTLRKVLENIILERIRSQGNLESILNDNQYGFR